MSDLTAMVLMVIVTLMALSIIWGTYFKRLPGAGSMKRLPSL
jgi:hypothetical protein